MKVVNFFGAPGAGKSTEAARLFVALKDYGVNVEMVREVAKILAWEGGLDIANRVPFFLLSQQMRLQEVMRDKVDVIVVDSPLLLPALYAENALPNIEGMCLEMFNRFDNTNFLVPRSKPYNPKGRTQTSGESLVLEGRILGLLRRLSVPYQTIRGGWQYVGWIANFIAGLEVMYETQN